jgi:catechol 2,3-dioxygenase-like lactoylglutathione lyase family enzyme
MLLGCSHVLLASDDVPRITRFFERVFSLTPRFENDMFSEFVLPSRFRLAFFKPVGVSAQRFRADASREGAALGLTVSDVDAFYKALTGTDHGDVTLAVSGRPKTHPWGEKSFLLTDPDGNLWEITQTPASDGMLTER